jgi:hypothetical protein
MNIFFLIISLLFCVNTTLAQDDEAGDVNIYSDARLAVLVRKNHSYVRLTNPDPVPKPVEMLKPQPQPNTYTGLGGLVHQQQQRVSYTGKGYRVQIYNGPDRNKAIAIKSEFMRSHPGVSTYISYVAPGFRVKIGDYRNRSDAEGMLREANSISSTPSMIVPDIVTISSY